MHYYVISLLDIHFASKLVNRIIIIVKKNKLYLCIAVHLRDGLPSVLYILNLSCCTGKQAFYGAGSFISR